MKRRPKLISHLNTLHNIRSIITAMKNLALIETGKINKFLIEQKKVVMSIENVAADFFNFYPQYLTDISHEKVEVCVLVGSERGFCGEFNEAIVATYQNFLTREKQTNIEIVAIGAKLITKLEEQLGISKQLEGPSTAEEIPGIILALVKNLADIYPTSWAIICNEESENAIQTNVIRPFSKIIRIDHKKHPTSPLLNLQSEKFFTNLLDEYFFALLYEVFYNSFLLENRRRSQHMDGALQWLDKTSKELVRDLNVSRQEEITESIEEIMLSVETLLKKVRSGPEQM
jgi:F-type H+-transporting ATPase subunit gamma